MLSADRMVCIVRIIMTSPTLRQAALEYRHHAVNVELAKRMGSISTTVGFEADLHGVGIDRRDRTRRPHRRGVDWEHVGVDDIVTRLDSTFDEFIE